MIRVHNQLDKPRDTSQWIVSGTNTFRLASRKILSSKHDTPLINFGGNRANIEKSMRCIWKADTNFKLIQRDQSGAEALIVAHLCINGNYRALFRNNIKPHTFVALHVFKDQFKKYYDPIKIDIACNTKIDDLKKLDFWKELDKLIRSSDNWAHNERYYFIAKKIVHASSYGMGGNKYRMSVLEESGGTIVLSKLDAEYHLMVFFKLFPEIHGWHSKVYEQVKKYKELRNLFGFPFKFTGYIDESNIREAYAFIPQSTVGTITNIAITETQEYIEEYKKNWHILNNDHDSFVVEAPDNDIDIKECSLIMKQYIEKEFTSPIDGTKFRMKSGLSIGRNWAPYSEKNLEGLKEIED